MNDGSLEIPLQSAPHRGPRIAITEKQRTDFVSPASLDEAETELTLVLGKIELIKGELIAKTLSTFSEEREYREWKKRAEIAISWARARRILLARWIEKYRKQSNKDEVANFRTPLSLEEARTRLASTLAEILLFKGDLGSKTQDDFSFPAEFKAWRSSITLSLGRLKGIKLQ